MVIDPWSLCAMYWDIYHLPGSDPTILHRNNLCKMEKNSKKTLASDAGTSRLFYPISNDDLPWHKGNCTYGNDHGYCATYAYRTSVVSQRFLFQSWAAIF